MITDIENQLEEWRDEFGKAYTERNVVDYHDRLPAFQHMLDGLRLDRILEVGCNRGHNMHAIQEIFPDAEVCGVEPNKHALAFATGAIPGNIYDLPFKNVYFDLAFTAGVLIHIPPQRLAEALKEVVRVSRRYVLAVEYFAEKDTSISYRGHDDLLWKRNFLKHYEAIGLKLVRSGDWEKEFDRSRWWLMEKH